VALRLRPARRRRRTTLRLSIPMIALPMLGLLVLIQAASLRSPLSEAEAPLAIAARYPTRGLTVDGPPQASAAATAVVGLGRRAIGTTEFRLRALGVVAGCAALGLLVWLGERLFSTRAGVMAAVLLIATQAGRSLLGTEFGVEPFYLVAMLMALGAIRNLSAEKRSLVRAGIAGGIAIALVGPSALWIPLLAIVWLRKLNGLTWRSLGIAVGTTAGATVVVAFVSALVSGVAPLPSASELPSWRASVDGFAQHLGELVPFLPLILLGLWNRPKQWRSQGSPRFLLVWTLLATGTMLVFGAFAPVWVALAMVLALATSWAVARAPRPHLTTAVAACVALGFAFGSFGPVTSEFDVDRWAVRETGKFLRRNLDANTTIAAPATARGRLAYYAKRSIAPLDGDSAGLDGLDYVVLDRRVLDGGLAPAGVRPPGELTVYGRRVQVIAEFGSWILARVEPTSANSAALHWRRRPDPLSWLS